MAAAAVAAINAEPGSVGVQRIGCYALMQLARDAAGAQTVLEAGGVEAVVTAMELQAADAADAEVHRFGCTTLSSLARSDAAHKQAVVDGGGVRAVVAAMRLHTADAELHHAGVATLSSLAFSDTAHKQAVVDGGGVAAVVSAMGLHTADAELQRHACGALASLAFGDAYACGDAYRQRAVVYAGGVAAVAAAMGRCAADARLHAADAEVHHAGVATLSSLAFSDAAHEVQRAGVATLSSLSVTHKQAVVDGGGGAAVVAAIGLHAADAGLQGNGCCALWNLASGGAACAQAVVEAGGVRALVAAMGLHQETAGNAAGALEMLAANNPMAVLEEVARTQTDCSSRGGLRKKLRACALKRLRAAEEGTAVPELEHAIKLAAAVQVDAAALNHAKGRLREILADAERRERRESFGLGSHARPEEFVCPITFDEMQDPVVASDGHTYERSAILAVLRDGKKKGGAMSPLTREPLSATVYPNRALKRRMQGYEEDMLRVAATAVANASDGTLQHGPAAAGGEPSSEPAPKRSKQEEKLDEKLNAKPVPLMPLGPAAASSCAAGGSADSSSSAMPIVVDLTGDD